METEDISARVRVRHPHAFIEFDEDFALYRVFPEFGQPPIGKGRTAREAWVDAQYVLGADRASTGLSGGGEVGSEVPAGEVGSEVPAGEVGSEVRASDVVGAAHAALAQRAALRDQPTGERSAARAAAILSAWTGEVWGEVDVWRCLLAVKLAREVQGGFHLDDYVDIAGYAGLLGECESGRSR